MWLFEAVTVLDSDGNVGKRSFRSRNQTNDTIEYIISGWYARGICFKEPEKQACEYPDDCFTGVGDSFRGLRAHSEDG